MPKAKVKQKRVRRGVQANINTSGLRPFQPGQSGNPGGRPKKSPVSDALRKMLELDQLPGRALPSWNVAEKAAYQLLKQALRTGKDFRLAPLVEVLDRVEGKARQRNEVSGPDGGPMAFELPGTREEIERRIAELEHKAKGGGDAQNR